MKQMSVLAFLFAALFLVFSTGTVSAGWYGETSGSDMSRDEDRSTSSEEMSAPDPASSSWQHEGPVETGTLPKGEDLSEAQSGVSDEIPSHEYGGLPFREGFDTGP